MALVVVAAAAAILYFTIYGDYAFLRAGVFTGERTGQYYATGQRLADRARHKNGHLEVVATAGTVENITRLVGPNGRCDPAFGFVQDGVPVPANAHLETLGRLPQAESLLLLARRGRALNSFNDLKGASIGIGRDGSGTDNLMRRLLENSDLKDLDLRVSNHDLKEQAEMVRDGRLDLAAFVIAADAALIRTLANAYDLEIVAPADIEGLAAREKWLRLGRIPAGFYNISKPVPATDKMVAQVDTLIMTNACTHRAERVAFLMLLSAEFPNFVRDNPPPAAKSADQAPLAEEARQFFVAGGPEMADRYFPWLVNLMSPVYWIYLAMAVTILFNSMTAFSRFKLWRIDANRELLVARLKTLSGLGSTPDHIKSLPPQAALKTPQDRQEAEDLVKSLEALRVRCQEQMNSIVTPMGSEMFYRYQESLVEDALAMLADLLRRPAARAPS